MNKYNSIEPLTDTHTNLNAIPLSDQTQFRQKIRQKINFNLF